jgi:hypothetical protein
VLGLRRSLLAQAAVESDTVQPARTIQHQDDRLCTTDCKIRAALHVELRARAGWLAGVVRASASDG